MVFGEKLWSRFPGNYADNDKAHLKSHLYQFPAATVTNYKFSSLNNTILSYSFVGWKLDMGLNGFQIKGSTKVAFLFGGYRGDLLFCPLFQRLPTFLSLVCVPFLLKASNAVSLCAFLHSHVSLSIVFFATLFHF